MMNEVLIHLHYVNLYGFERTKSEQKIQSLIQSKVSTKQIPPVKVLRIDEKNFRLIDDGDGGHHRAMASYLGNYPLNVIIEGNSPESVEKLKKQGWFNVKDISIGGDDVYEKDNY